MDLSSYFDELIENSKNANPKVDGDYIKDGILYCGKCNTPKQAKLTICGKEVDVYPLCKCGLEQRQREEAMEKQKKRDEQIKLNREKCFPDIAMRSWTFANDDMANKEVTDAMRLYVDNFTKFRDNGKGLLLYGSVGTGKTFAACEVANALVDMGYMCHVTNFSRILNTLQGTFDKQDYLDELNTYHLLVIDDLGIERSTEYAKEQVFNIIDSRYRSNRPMIITTNLNCDQMLNTHNPEEKRIYDRIIERCHPIEVKGQSRRKKAFADGYSEMKKMLGL